MSASQTQRPILFAFDGSEHARSAILEAARQLCHRRQAIVLTVWRPLSALPLASAPAVEPVEALDRSSKEEAREVAGEGARLAESVGFDATTLIESGQPIWGTILAAADDRDVGTVVLGSHGRTGIRRVLLGSVAAGVVAHAARPVLVVHARPDWPQQSA